MRPTIWSTYQDAKQQWRRLKTMTYFVYDMRHTFGAMFWPEPHTDAVTLSSALLFQYHKLEKGLVMPGKRRLFGVDPARATMRLVRRWTERGHDPTDPVYLGAIEALAAYERRLTESGLDPDDRILGETRRFLGHETAREPALSTPQPLPAGFGPGTGFAELALARRSVRDYRPDPVPRSLVEMAVAVAQLSPSACNRQPCRVLVVSEPGEKESLLRYQNGNRGFGHLAPHVAILSADERSFFDASERHEPYIGGGLFAMSLILALREQGVASCCLNWCVPPAHDMAVHRLFDLPSEHRIIMLISFGWPPEGCQVPRSPRRSRQEVLRYR